MRSLAGRDSVIIHIDGDDTGYELSLKQVESKTKKSTNNIQSELKAVNGVAVGVATAIGTIGAAVVGLGVKYNAEMEQYKAGFTTMLGSAEQAEKTIASLKSFAEKTPFELTDLANASTTLLAFGENVDNLEADLKMLGDISLGNQEKFKGLALVFGQVQSQGKLMGQDLLQMINQGFNPLQVISEKTGESMASLKDKMSKGQISFEMVADAMKTATSAGGQFFNAMEAQSKTFTGQVSTLKDNVTSLFGEMSEDISQALTEDVLPKAIEMVGDLKEAWADGTLQKWIKAGTVALTGFGTAIVGLNVAVFANDMVQLVKGTKDFTTATKLGTTAQKLFNAELLKNPYTLLAVGLATVVAGVIAYDAATESAAEKTEKIRDSVYELSAAHKETMSAANDAGSSFLAEASKVTALKDSLYQMESQLKSGTLSQEEAESVQKQFEGTASELEALIPGITSNLYDETGAIDIQKSSVDKLADSYIKLAMAKATAAAYEAKMTEVAGQLIDAKEIKKQAADNYSKAQAKEDAAGYAADSMGFRSKEEADAFYAMSDANVLVGTLESDLKELGEELAAEQRKIIEFGGTTEETGKKVVKTAGTTAGATKKTTDTVKEEFNKQLKNLQYAHETGEKSDAEYYKELGELRNKYFETGSEEWNQYASEIYKWQKSILTKVKEDSIAAVEEFQKAKEEIVSGLDDDIADTYQTVTVRDGENALSYTKLADIGAENKKLDEYNSMLDKLFERTGGELPDYVMQQLKSMSVDEGANYVSAMLRASDSDFEAYINGLEEKAERQGLIADKLMTDDAEKFAQKVQEIYGTIPEGFFDIGEDSATAFAEGFGPLLAAELKNIMDSMMTSFHASFTPAIMSAGVMGAGTINHNSYTYNLQPSGESVYAQRKAIDDQNTYNSMIGEG